MLPYPCTGLPFIVEDFLDFLEKLFGDDRFMKAMIIFPIPLELAVVNGVVQNFRDGAAGDGLPVPARE